MTDLLLLQVCNTMSTDQQSVGIDTVGGTGKHGAIVLTLADHEAVYLMRLYNEDLIYLIGQDLVQNTEHKQVSLADLVQVGKELGAGQTPVSGNNTMGALSTYGKAGWIGNLQRKIQTTITPINPVNRTWPRRSTACHEGSSPPASTPFLRNAKTCGKAAKRMPT